MTPHILLLTDMAGVRFLLTIQAIENIAPLDQGCALYTTLGERYEVRETFDAIVEVLGGLVMKPHRGPVIGPPATPRGLR